MNRNRNSVDLLFIGFWAAVLGLALTFSCGIVAALVAVGEWLVKTFGPWVVDHAFQTWLAVTVTGVVAIWILAKKESRA